MHAAVVADVVAPADAAPVYPVSAPAPAAPTRVARPAAASEPAPVAVAAVQAPVEAFVLPMDTLHRIAEGSGLQWVNSDAGKILAVQAAIAAEPVTARVPRARKPAVQVDDGPLVLVETRKDLSQLKLPFETSAGAASAGTPG